MGYNLGIGELNVIYDNGGDARITLDFEPEKGHNADFLNVGEPTDGSNMRWPSYASWKKVIIKLDMLDLFFNDDDSLMRCHPDTVPLNEEHRKVINSKYKEFKRKYPNAKPNYNDEDNEENAALVRIEWLKYWVNWALDNCEKPVFHNS